jgi:hypothetical protein
VSEVVNLGTLTVTASVPYTNSKFDARQVRTDQLETTLALHDRRQAQIHTAMVCQVIQFYPDTMTVDVQPCIQGIWRQPDGTVQYFDIAVLKDVPVIYPGGGQHTITFPVNAGDYCLVIFCERSIDNWYQMGGVQQPSDWRMHDINDGFALVGIRPNPTALGGQANAAVRRTTRENLGPVTNTTATQIRSDDGLTAVTVDGPTNTVTVTCSGTTLTIDGATGVLNVNAPNGMTFTTPTLHVTGAITGGYGTANSVGLMTHTHDQGSDSHGDSEKATNAPNPGT